MLKKWIALFEGNAGLRLAYHGTTVSSLSGIIADGLNPNDGSRGIWPDEYPVVGKLFFADNEEGAEHYAWESEKALGEPSVILRFPMPSVLFDDPLGHEGDYFTNVHIPPSEIEVRSGAAGSPWEPLVGFEIGDVE